MTGFVREISSWNLQAPQAQDSSPEAFAGGAASMGFAFGASGGLEGSMESGGLSPMVDAAVLNVVSNWTAAAKRLHPGCFRA